LHMYVALTHERQTLALRMDLSNADLASCSIRDRSSFPPDFGTPTLTIQ
jgi:hypothetical protein